MSVPDPQRAATPQPHGDGGRLQRTLDFSRGEKLWMLRAAVLPAFRCRSGRRVSAAVQRAVLRVMDDHARTNRSCILTEETIARESGYTKGTVVLAVQALETQCLLGKRKRSTQKGRAANEYTIRWENLREYCPADGFAKSAGQTSAKSALRAAKCDVRAAKYDVQTTDLTASYNRLLEPPPPTPSKAAAAPRDEWAEVEEALKAELSQWRTALEAVRASGCTPAEILAAVAWWRAHAPTAGWESPAGVLYTRLLNTKAGQSADEGWPPRSEAVERSRRDEFAALRTRIDSLGTDGVAELVAASGDAVLQANWTEWGQHDPEQFRNHAGIVPRLVEVYRARLRSEATT